MAGWSGDSVELIFIHGPPAVGKLTVGKALSAASGLPLFHNHLVVDAVLSVFPFGSESAGRMRESLWLTMFAEVQRPVVHQRLEE